MTDNLLKYSVSGFYVVCKIHKSMVAFLSHFCCVEMSTLLCNAFDSILKTSDDVIF